MQSKIKNSLKIVLDILVAFIFAVLFDKTVLGGMVFHEIAGLAIGAFIVIHIIQHRAWIKGVTQKIFSAKLPTRTKLAYVVDIILIIDIAAIIITGILMSKVVFAGIIGVHTNVKGLHQAASYLALFLIGVHVGLSWNRVLAIVNQLLRIPKKRALSVVAFVFTLAVFTLGTYNIVSTGYAQKLTSITTAFSESGGGERDSNEAESEETVAKTTRAITTNATTSAASLDAISSASLNSGENSDTQTMLEGPGSGGQQGGQNLSGEMKGKGGHQGAGLFAMLYQNLSIVAAFAILVYQIDKLLRFRRRKNTKLQPA